MIFLFSSVTRLVPYLCGLIVQACFLNLNVSTAEICSLPVPVTRRGRGRRRPPTNERVGDVRVTLAAITLCRKTWRIPMSFSIFKIRQCTQPAVENELTRVSDQATRRGEDRTNEYEAIHRVW